MLPIACSDPVEPHGDVAAAYVDWLRGNYSDYVFDISTAWSMTPRSPYYRVRVEGDSVVSATDENGDRSRSAATIDDVWRWILTAHEAGELNSARFDRRGVPLEVDMGDRARDGGGAVWIRSFEPAT